MPIIAFEFDYKHAVEAAELDWMTASASAPAIVSMVEAPQIGTTVRRLVNSGFAEFLKTRGIPFQEV